MSLSSRRSDRSQWSDRSRSLFQFGASQSGCPLVVRLRRPPRRVRGAPLTFRVRVVGGPSDGALVVMQPPLPRTFEREKVAYRVDMVAGHGYIAMTDEQSDHMPVLAWRAWQVDERPGAATTLKSGNDAIWTVEGPIVAECKSGADGEPAHDAPQFDCQCGIYCTTTLAALRNAGFQEPDVYGLIAIWGRIEEHDYGYRAQRAYPQAIIVNSKATSLGVFRDTEVAHKLRLRADDLGHSYRVPAVLAMPERAVKVVAELIGARRLPSWTEAAAPSDVRLHTTLARIGAR